MSKNESANAEKSAAGGGESQTNVWWHDADSSRRRRAVLIFREGWVCAKTEDGERRDARLKEMEISPRIGNAPRRLAFADGVLLSADDNDFIDAMLKLHGGRRASFFLHLIESRGRIIIAAIAGAILLAAAAVFYGVPAAAKIAAGAVSHEYLTEISEDIYAELRRRNYIPASKLPPATAARIEKIFAETVSDYQDSGYDYRLRFHEFPPNAFAFPDGLVVMSDALAALLSEDELRAVFAHEAGHVELRHGMRAFLESAGVAAFLTFAGGDWTGLAAGTVLLNLKYSRDHEREADCFAYRYLQRHRMSGALLGDSLQKMNDA
ncbi:MAG: M48 family metallopeptidase, partial [Gammaproteobacteria bacterium]